MDRNFAELRQAGLELFPNPQRQALAGGVFQPGNVVEIVVIELVVERLEGNLDVTKIHDPTSVRARFATDVQLDLERVPMQARALVAGRDIG